MLRKLTNYSHDDSKECERLPLIKRQSIVFFYKGLALCASAWLFDTISANINFSKISFVGQE